MTDERHPRPDDDDLAARVRTGIDALAREAGAAPPFSRAAAAAGGSGDRSHRPWLMAAVIIVVAGLTGAIAYAMARSDDRQQVSSGDPTTTAPGTRPLLGTRWWLVSATDGGEEVEVPTAGTPNLELRFLDGGSCEGVDHGCYDGPRVEGSDACNGVTRKTTVVGDTVTLGDDYGVHTAMGCPPQGLGALLPAFFRAGEISYSITGDELVLTSASGDVVLTYRALDAPFGPTSSLVVDEGELGEKAYRLVWAEGGLDFEAVDWGSAGVGADPSRVNAMLQDVAGQSYLFGIVPATATRVVYEPAGGEPQEIGIHDVGDADFAVIGQLVDRSASSWDVVAYDATGAEIHRLHWG